MLETFLTESNVEVEVQSSLTSSTNIDHDGAFDFSKYATFGVASAGVERVFSVYRWIGGAWRDTAIDITLNSGNNYTYELDPTSERLISAKRLLFVLNSGTAGAVFVDLQR